MQLPVISSLRELHPSPRRFLFFTAFNVVSWQCIVGPVMVLIAREVEMPASWVGLLISVLPFSSMLVVFTVPLVMKLGPKRLMVSTWFMRNLIVCPVFLMPMAIRWGGQSAGWFVLMASTLGFCLMRAIGSGGWFPWLHEVVPEEQRGTYFSTEAATTQLINVAIILGQSAMLVGNPSVQRFLLVYVVGIVAGLASLTWMWRVPGGEGVAERISMQESLSSYRIVLADRRFMLFVGLGSLCFSATSWFGAAYVLYLRDILHLREQIILTIMAAGSSGVLFTIRYWGRFADHSGSGRAMFKTLTAHSLCALSFLALIPGGRWTLIAVWPAVILLTIFGAAFWMAVHRAMLNQVQEEGRIAYTNAWTLGTSFALGITPVLAGQLIGHWDMWGFRLCFLLSGAIGLGCALASERIVRDGRPATWTRWELLNPILPMRTLARVAWITLGLHESNRDDGGSA